MKQSEDKRNPLIILDWVGNIKIYSMLFAVGMKIIKNLIVSKALLNQS